MGSLHAAEFANAVRNGLALERALTWHLTANHYPPVPVSMIPVCIAAIEAGNTGDWDQQIALPEGVSYRGSETAPASAIIEQHHLESFLDQEEDEADWEDDDDEDAWDDDDEEDEEEGDDWDDDDGWDDEDEWEEEEE